MGNSIEGFRVDLLDEYTHFLALDEHSRDTDGLRADTGDVSRDGKFQSS